MQHPFLFTRWTHTRNPFHSFNISAATQPAGLLLENTVFRSVFINKAPSAKRAMELSLCSCFCGRPGGIAATRELGTYILGASLSGLMQCHICGVESAKRQLKCGMEIDVWFGTTGLLALLTIVHTFDIVILNIINFSVTKPHQHNNCLLTQSCSSDRASNQQLFGGVY